MINADQLVKLTCQDCSKHEYCKAPCVFIDKLAGKDKSIRELLPPPDIRDTDQDYKQVLNELNEAREANRKKTIQDIRSLENSRLKAITALLYAGFSVQEIPHISTLIDIKPRRIYQIISKQSQ